MNWGILTLMVVVYGVLMGIAGFFAYSIYRSKRLARSAEVPAVQLIHFQCEAPQPQEGFWLCPYRFRLVVGNSLFQ